MSLPVKGVQRHALLTGIGAHSRWRSPLDRPVRLLAVVEAESVTGPLRNLIELSQACSDADLRLDIAVFERAVAERRGNLPIEKLVSTLTTRGIPVHRLQERFRYDISAIKQLRELIARLKPDIVESHAVKSHLLIRLSKIWQARAWIAFHHGYTATDAKTRAFNDIDRWSIRAATEVITVCESFRCQLLKRGVDGRRISVVHNAIDSSRCETSPARIDELRRDLNLEPAVPVILSVGRFSREKGQHDLVEALAMLSTGSPGVPWRALLVGDGVDSAGISQRLVHLNLQHRVTLVRHTTEIAAYYRLSTVFVLASHSEGSPNVLLEAALASVPIVATEVGGVPEMFANERTALIVPPRATTALARAIERVLLDTTLCSRLATLASAHVRSRFTVTRRRDALLKIYRSTIA